MRQSHPWVGDTLFGKGPMRQSTHLTELESHYKELIPPHPSSHKNMTHSTFLNYPQAVTPSSHALRHSQLQTVDPDIKRARSLKAIMLMKEPQTPQKDTANVLNNNVVRLRIEQMTFKYKTKVNALLKEIGASSAQLARFAELERVEDILEYLGQRVRERMVSNQIKQSNIQKVRSRDKMTINEYEMQMDSLARKLKEKQAAQKVLKIKLREAHEESQNLLSKLGLKEKQLSAKSTEIYQLKTQLKQQEKSFQTMRVRCQLLEQEGAGYREQFELENKEIVSSRKQVEVDNAELRERVGELEEELEITLEKHKTLTEMNNRLNEELTRWRERLNDKDSIVEEDKNSRESADVVVNMPAHLKKSTNSMSGIVRKSSQNKLSLELENMKLSTRIEQLQKQNRQLSRDLLSYPSRNQKYEKTTEDVQSLMELESLREQPREVWQLELERHFKKKVEDVANEWKEKLYSMVHKYEDELETVQQKADGLALDRQQQEGRLKALANEKYQLENKLIARQNEIYSLLKCYKNVKKSEEGSVLSERSQGGAVQPDKAVKIQDDLDNLAVRSNCEE